MSVRAYPAYRSISVEWVGSVPFDWSLEPLARLASEVDNANVSLSERNRLSLSYGEIIERDIESADGLLPTSFDTYNVIQTNDIVLRLTDLQNYKRSLRIAISNYDGIITSAYTTIRPERIHAAFLAYLLRAYDI